MRILQLTGYFFPEKAASIYLVENRLDAFAKESFEMIIYASRPTRGLSDSEYKAYKNKKTEMMYDGKLKVHRFAMYREGHNPILRALRYSFIWIIQLWFGLREKNVDCVYLESTPPIQGLLGAFLKRFKKQPFVYCLQDIFPDSLAGTSLAPKGGFLWKIGRVIENFTYRNADKIIVISEDFKKNIMTKGVPEEKIEVIYNWVDEQAVKEVKREDNILFDRYRLNRNKFYVTYCGNIGLTQNMDLLMEVAKALEANSDIHFVLIGNGAYKEQLEDIIKQRNITNVTLLPFQPYEDISHVFSLGDAGLVISKPGVGENSVPSKTWSIMAASRPVLANFDENELKTIIEKHDCGIFTKSGDKVALCDAITTLYKNREACRKYGMNGRKFVMDNLTKEVGTAKYVKVVKEVVNAHKKT